MFESSLHTVGLKAHIIYIRTASLLRAPFFASGHYNEPGTGPLLAIAMGLGLGLSAQSAILTLP